jgi:hypothetical protein
METIVVKSVIDNVISAEKVIPAVAEKKEDVSFDLGFLLKQRDQIQKDYDRDAAVLAQRQKELDEVTKIINDAKTLGATEVKPIEGKEIVK